MDGIIEPTLTMSAQHRQYLLRFLRASLGVARSLARSSKVTFRFSDRAFDPIAIPFHDSQIALPFAVNAASPNLVAHLRMRVDLGAAWIRESDNPNYAKHNPAQDIMPFDLGLVYQSLEKARREVRLIQVYQGAAANTLSYISPRRKEEPQDPYYIKFSYQDGAWAPHQAMVIGEGIYFAALLKFLPPDLSAQLPAETRYLAKIWANRLEECSCELDLLQPLINNQSEFCAAAAEMTGWLSEQKQDLLAPASPETIERLNIQPKHRFHWRTASLADFHRSISNLDHALPKEAHNFVSAGHRTRNRRKAEKRHKREIAQNKRQREQAGLHPILDVIASTKGTNKPIYMARDGNTIHDDAASDAIWLKLSDIFAEAVTEVNTRKVTQPYTPLDLTTRRGDFRRAYLSLRKEHEQVISVGKNDATCNAIEQAWAQILTPDKLAKNWDRLLKDNRAHAMFQRRLARNLETWLKNFSGTQAQHDCDDGLLDLSRLSQIITNPINPAAHIGSTPTLALDAAVSMLFDFSASMDGDPIQTASIFSYYICRALERSKIHCEVLGFTTDSDKSVHIIVKDFRQRMVIAQRNFGFAQESSLMGSTNDTDAILWAGHRLSSRSESRKILVIVSDVQPNSSFIRPIFPDLSYDSLLKTVIMDFEQREGIDIIGVGVGRGSRQVHRFYENHIGIGSMAELGPALLPKLKQALAADQARQRLMLRRKDPAHTVLSV